jgi:hypothetical protein
MKTDEENRLEKNELAERLKALAAKAKGGQVGNVRFVVLLLVLAAAVGGWWYLRGSNKRSEADMWRTYDSLAGAEAYEKFADGHANTVAGRAARLQQARVLLGQGVQELTTTAFDAEARKKTVEKVEQARDLFAKLADEFKDDLTLKAQSLDGAARAELALVGVPKTEGSLANDYRGSVKKAAEFYRAYAKAVGESTKPGEAAAQKAADLEAKEAEVQTLGSSLNSQFAPKKFEEPKAPGALTPPAAAAPIPPPTVPGIPAAPPGEKK